MTTKTLVVGIVLFTIFTAGIGIAIFIAVALWALWNGKW